MEMIRPVSAQLPGSRRKLTYAVVRQKANSNLVRDGPRALFLILPSTLPQGSSLVSEIQVSDCIDVEDLRERLRKMTDAELLRFCKDNRYMCGPYANLGKPPLEAFVIQLREARAEWKRRYPKANQFGFSVYPSKLAW